MLMTCFIEAVTTSPNRSTRGKHSVIDCEMRQDIGLVNSA